MAGSNQGSAERTRTELTVRLELPSTSVRLDQSELASLLKNELDDMLRDLSIDADSRVAADANKRASTTEDAIGLLHLGSRSLPVTGLDVASAESSAWQFAHVLHAHRQLWLPEAVDAQLDVHLPPPPPDSFGSTFRRVARGVAPKLMKQLAPRPVHERRDVVADALLRVTQRGVPADALWSELSEVTYDAGETIDAAALAERSMVAAPARLGVHLAARDMDTMTDDFEPADLVDELWDALGLVVSVAGPTADKRTRAGDVRISINRALLPPLAAPVDPTDSIAARIGRDAGILAQIHAGSLLNADIVDFRLLTMEASFPALIDAARRRWSVEHITSILRAILDSGLPIHDLRGLLEAMLAIPAGAAEDECDPARVASDVRAELGIAGVKRSVHDGELPAYELTGVNTESPGEIGAASDRLVDALRAAEARRPDGLRPVLIAPSAMTDQIRDVVRVPFPAVSVLATDELPSVLRIHRLERLDVAAPG